MIAPTTTKKTVTTKPNPGPQTEAHASSADILIYGGGAGGGKTRFLVAEPLRHKDRVGFDAVIFRRTSPQITQQGGIWSEASSLYPLYGGRMREGKQLDCKFPSGASIAFDHLHLEKTKYEHQGAQLAYLGFDELTHFTETQFFYLLGRMRTKCGIKPYCRATCNPDAGSWVAEFISWWIDPDTGFIIKERCGHIRYFVRVNTGEREELVWADSKQELIDRYPQFKKHQIKSATFIEAMLKDNPHVDKSYEGNLLALPKIERERLLRGNWKATEGSIIDASWIKDYSIINGNFRFLHTSHAFDIPINQCRRIATIDTAGTSKEKAAVLRGDPPSWSVCAVWDALPTFATTVDGSKCILSEMLFLRYVWRNQVDWNQLKASIPEVLHTWNVSKAYIENAHYGQPLSKEIRGCSTELVGPVISGMDDSSRGAKLERAVASGLLTRLELGKIFVPVERPAWLVAWLRELTVWTGLPIEPADQIDTASYACYVTKRNGIGWGGVIKAKGQ